MSPEGNLPAAPVNVVPVRAEPVVSASDGLWRDGCGTMHDDGRRGAAAGPGFAAAARSSETLQVFAASRQRRAAAGGVRRVGAGISTSQAPAIRLARALADTSRAVLVGLASGDTAIRGISSEPAAAGLAELANGAATFGAIITKDRLSPLHLISAGHGPVDRTTVLAAPGMVANFNALGRSYDHVIVDAGDASGPSRACRRDRAPCGTGDRKLGECRHGRGARAVARRRLCRCAHPGRCSRRCRRDRSCRLMANGCHPIEAHNAAIDPASVLAKDRVWNCLCSGLGNQLVNSDGCASTRQGLWPA